MTLLSSKLVQCEKVHFNTKGHCWSSKLVQCENVHFNTKGHCWSSKQVQCENVHFNTKGHCWSSKLAQCENVHFNTKGHCWSSKLAQCENVHFNTKDTVGLANQHNVKMYTLKTQKDTVSLANQHNVKMYTLKTQKDTVSLANQNNVKMYTLTQKDTVSLSKYRQSRLSLMKCSLQLKGSGFFFNHRVLLRREINCKVILFSKQHYQQAVEASASECFATICKMKNAKHTSAILHSLFYAEFHMIHVHLQWIPLYNIYKCNHN